MTTSLDWIDALELPKPLGDWLAPYEPSHLYAFARQAVAEYIKHQEVVAWQCREMLDEDWSCWKECRSADLEGWYSRVERRPDLYEVRALCVKEDV